MKPTSIIVRCATLAAAAALHVTTSPAATNQQPRLTSPAIPLIVMEQVPLIDAVRNLARQAELNYIIDPRVPGSGIGAGMLARQPNINVRLENVTALEALDYLLRSNNLVLIDNPATTIVRIAPANLGLKPVPASSVAADTSRVTADTSGVIPLIVMDEVPLDEVIKNLAKQAKLSYSLDPELSSAPDFRGGVTFRWENVTARQALAAIVDNYDLAMTEDPATAIIRFTRKPPEK